MAEEKGGRYDVSDLIENQYQPGSRGRVLSNLLGIKSKREMDLAEAEALKRATDVLVESGCATNLWVGIDGPLFLQHYLNA